jgi:hypothetical protein
MVMEMNSERLNFEEHFLEAYRSALTKFDSLDALFTSGLSVVVVASMIEEELSSDQDFAPWMSTCDSEKVQKLVRARIGSAMADWKKHSGNSTQSATSTPGRNLERWPSTESYQEWVVGQVMQMLDAEPEIKWFARKSLERSLLEDTIWSVSTKYDGTCVGKDSDGTIMGRNLVIQGTSYQHTSLTVLSSCDVAGFRLALSDLLGWSSGA